MNYLFEYFMGNLVI